MSLRGDLVGRGALIVSSDLRTEVRDGVGALPGPEVLVGGVTAEFADMSDEITEKPPLAIALVLCCSFVFLIAALRSIALPIKAIVLNLLAAGSDLGTCVGVSVRMNAGAL